MASLLSHTPAGFTQLEAQVLAGIEKEEITHLLQALIRQRSDFPPGDCRGAIQVVVERLNQEKVPYQIFSRQDHQPNLVAYIGHPERKPRLMYHSHIDTVPAGELERWSFDPFSGAVKDGRVYGRGAGDDKASVAAQVMAVLALRRAGLPAGGCLQLAVVSDEETGGLQGTQWLHQQGLLATDALVVGEQTENHLAIAERVACGLDLTVFGRSAHGAMPWAGENAVLKMAKALTWMQDHLFPILEKRRHPYLPPPTLNIGKIYGGIQWNIVPERCTVELDRRLIPGETRESAMEEIGQVLDQYAAQVEPLRYELYSGGEVAANINTPPDAVFVQAAQEALFDVSGVKRPLTGYFQTSDGRWFARDGIPIIIFGPSDPAVAHAADEHVHQEQLVEASRFLALLAMRWLGYE
jgi:succinyl-diaminopimelate desuccinylase